MNNRSNIQAYHSAMAQVKTMLERGIIDENDIVSIEDKLAQKYELKFGSIYRENDLQTVRKLQVTLENER